MPAQLILIKGHVLIEKQLKVASTGLEEAVEPSLIMIRGPPLGHSAATMSWNKGLTLINSIGKKKNPFQNFQTVFYHKQISLNTY